MAGTTWNVETYLDRRGRDVIVPFLIELNRTGRVKAATKVIRAIDLLRDNGFALPDEVVRKVRGDLWELRASHQRGAYRILFYNPSGRRMVLLHVIQKKQQAIPESDILKALDRMPHDRTRRGL
jgi:phage-related protein